jgi:predicted peptidase
MKASCALILPSLLWLLCLPALADTGFLDRAVTLRGETYAYQVYVPVNYSANSQWPVIVYLHGNEHQGSDGMRQTNAALPDAIRERRLLFPAVVVFPQARTGTWWHSPEMQEMVTAELDQTVAEFHGDPSRVYLTGFSMGGTGSYRLAYHNPNRFAALVVVAGRVEPGPNYTAERAQIDRKTNVFVAAPDPFAALAASLRNLPVWIFHGNADETVAVEQSRRLVAALKNQNANVRYTEYPGVKHVEAAVKAYSDEAMIEWLLEQRRPKLP